MLYLENMFGHGETLPCLEICEVWQQQGHQVIENLPQQTTSDLWKSGH